MKTKQFFLTITISIIIGFLAGNIFGLIIGLKINQHNGNQTTIETTLVLERLKEQSFLVTRSVITDEEVTINIDQGSAWSNFWWGHEITANGQIQTDIGIDLDKIESSDIQVNDTDKEIIISFPEPVVYNSSLKGDIEVTTQSGILKKLLASDANEDYNLALNELSSQAENTILNNQDLFDESTLETIEILQYIFNDTGYTIKEK